MAPEKNSRAKLEEGNSTVKLTSQMRIRIRRFPFNFLEVTDRKLGMSLAHPFLRDTD
jgi:hypothetical protein